MSGSDIANEVAAALAEAGAEVGAGVAFPCTIKRRASGVDDIRTPWEADVLPDGAPTLYEVAAIQSTKRIRDASGTLTGVVRRVLAIDAINVEPLKSDVVAVGVALADVTSTTVFEEILEVVAISPAGVPLMYKLELAA